MAEVLEPAADQNENGDGGAGDRDRDHLRGLAIFEGLRRRKPGQGAGPRVDGYVVVPGTRIAGQVGEVYQARDLSLSRDVAIKFLKKGYLEDEVQRARLRNEAQALAMLQGSEVGQHVVQIHARSRPDEDQQYLVLEWLENGSLQQRLNANGPMEAVSAAKLVRTIAQVVHGIHALKIIHRDLKPGNVLLTHDDQPKLADFGLAQFDRQTEGLTHQGEPIGTPEYMSPEQACGDADEVDAISDVYSVGAILYACLTGRPPFQGPIPSQTIQIICKDETPLIPPERFVPMVPRDLSTICQKCLTRKKQARYGSAAELADDLGRYIEGRPILARRAGRVESLFKLMKRNRTTSALIGLVVMTLFGGVIASLLFAQETGKQRDRANRIADQQSRSLLESIDLTTFELDRSITKGIPNVVPGAPGDGRLRSFLPQLERMIQTEGNGSATRFLRGAARVRLSDVLRELGQRPEALRAAQEAEPIMRALILEEGPADDTALFLAAALGDQGILLGQAGKPVEAIVKLSEAVGLLAPRVRDDAPFLLHRLGRIQNVWANCIRFSGEKNQATLDAAKEHYRAAIDAFGRAAQTSPNSRDWQARTLSNLSLLIGEDEKRPADGLPLAEQAVVLARSLVQVFPVDLKSREGLASCLTNVGELLMLLGETASARPIFSEALKLYQELSAEVKDSQEFRWSVAMALSNMGNSFKALPDADLSKAADFLGRSDRLYQELLQASPENKDMAEYADLNRQRLADLEKLNQPKL